MPRMRLQMGINLIQAGCLIDAVEKSAEGSRNRVIRELALVIGASRVRPHFLDANATDSCQQHLIDRHGLSISPSVRIISSWMIPVIRSALMTRKSLACPRIW